MTNLSNSGWVQTVNYNVVRLNDSVCLLLAKVMPSQRLNSPPHVATMVSLNFLLPQMVVVLLVPSSASAFLFDLTTALVYRAKCCFKEMSDILSVYIGA